MKRNKKVLILVLIMALLVSMFQFKNNIVNAVSEESKIKITVTTIPLKEFAQKIGGENVEVNYIVPEGIRVQDFEPKICDLDELLKSKIFIYNGFGLEPWVENLKEDLNDYSVKTINASVNVGAIVKNKTRNPYVWLSLKEAKKQAIEVKKVLCKVDNKNKTYYEDNYDTLIAEIDKLIQEYEEKFKSLNNKEFVTEYSSFAYLARDYGLNNKSILGSYNESEATTSNKEELIKYCKDKNIKVLFDESQGNSEGIVELAEEINAKVEKLYSLESLSDDLSYVETMKVNLETIYKSLAE